MPYLEPPPSWHREFFLNLKEELESLAYAIQWCPRANVRDWHKLIVTDHSFFRYTITIRQGGELCLSFNSPQTRDAEFYDLANPDWLDNVKNIIR